MTILKFIKNTGYVCISAVCYVTSGVSVGYDSFMRNLSMWVECPKVSRPFYTWFRPLPIQEVPLLPPLRILSAEERARRGQPFRKFQRSRYIHKSFYGSSYKMEIGRREIPVHLQSLDLAVYKPQ